MYKGIILEANINVGSFDYFGNNLNKTIKTINNVIIDGKFIDIDRGCSNTKLIYKYIANHGPVILGFGVIYYNFGSWCNGKIVTINECFLINSLKEDKYEN